MVVFFLPSCFAGVPAPVLAQIAITAHADRSGPALGAMFPSRAVGPSRGCCWRVSSSLPGLARR